MGGLLDSLIDRGLETGSKNLKELKMFKEKYEQMTVSQRCDLVKVCRAEKMWRSDAKKLMLAIRDPIIQVLLGALEQVGGERKQGRAPASYMERELQAYLEALED